MKKSPGPAELRDNPLAIAVHLTDALAENDLRAVVLALGHAIKAQNVVALAKAAGVPRAGLYRTFANDRNPQLGRVMEVLAALNVQLVATPMARTPSARKNIRNRPDETRMSSD